VSRNYKLRRPEIGGLAGNAQPSGWIRLSPTKNRQAPAGAISAAVKRFGRAYDCASFWRRRWNPAPVARSNPVSISALGNASPPRWSCSSTLVTPGKMAPRLAAASGKLLFALGCRRLFVHQDLNRRVHALVEADRNLEFTDVLQRFVEMDLAAIDVETLGVERGGDVA